MPTFQYAAIRMGENTKVQGTINAETERQARELLRNQELYPTSVKPLSQSGGAVKGKKVKKEATGVEAQIKYKLARVGLKEKISFTQNLTMMVKAGIPVTEALTYMENYTDNPKFKKLVNQIRMDILSGYSLSQALAQHPKTFDDIYVSIVQAGELSGELEVVLLRLSKLLHEQAALKKKVIAAMIYPAIVISFVVLALVVALAFVIPTFTKIYKDLGVKLPLITQILVSLSDFMLSFWYIIIVVVGASVYGLRKFYANPSGREMVDEFLLKIPVASAMINAVACSYFVSTLHVSFGAGLPITECMYMACKTVTHTTLRAAFEQVSLQIQAGQRLANALADIGILPDMVLVMFSTGEESGSLEEMLTYALEYLENEVNERLEILMSMMEPVLLLVMGAVVLVLALAIYMPLFSMYGNLGK